MDPKLNDIKIIQKKGKMKKKFLRWRKKIFHLC